MPYDVFLSFNSSDREAAKSIADYLREQGLTVFVDESYLKPGQNWVEGLENALDACKAVAVLLGPHGFGKWQKAEMHLALDRHQNQPAFPVVPVILPGNEDPPTGFLSLNTWVDLKSDVHDARGLARLLAAIQGQAPIEADFDPRAEVCPYRGLLAFREEDQPFFFGRDDDTAELVKRVRNPENPVVGVIGRSGSGKSSLVYAGLIPELRTPSGPEAPWEILTLRPHKDPLWELITAFEEAPESKFDRVKWRDERAADLASGKVKVSQLVAMTLAEVTGSERLLIFVDQWEELYTQVPRDVDKAKRKEIEGERLLFVNSLLEATENSPCTLVFTVRADFYDQILLHPTLTQHVDRCSLSLGPMSQAELQQCIEKPAAAAGYQFADGLVNTILNDASEEPGRLPLLEYLLQELWKHREGDEFTHKGYETAGGVVGAIATRAEAEYLKIEQENKKLVDAVRRVFVSLVTPGEGREDTRATIALPTNGPEREVVDHFSSASVRLLTTSSQSVEVSHEALIRHWARLREDWLAKNRDILRARDRIRASQKDWEEHKKARKRLLPPGVQLEEGRTLLRRHGDVLIDDVEDYIRRSLRRNLWRRVRGISLLVGLTAVGLAVGFFGLMVVLAVTQGGAGEIRALDDYNREIYEKETKMPEPPPAQLNEAVLRPYLSFENRVGMDMVWCWPGSFLMGSGEEEPFRDSDETLHEVELSRGFWIARHELTQEQWLKLMAENPSVFRVSLKHPVENVSWHHALKFCKQLTRLEQRLGAIPSDWEYSLPSEAQWEYACRAGSGAPFSAKKLGDTAWYLRNSFLFTHRVGMKRPNPWGLYDMHGNVFEWCRDGYDHYPREGVVDPAGPREAYRVFRGGGWSYDARYCRSANRGRSDPEYRSYSIGFRPVLVPAS